jgi:hypothetical protein
LRTKKIPKFLFLKRPGAYLIPDVNLLRKAKSLKELEKPVYFFNFKNKNKNKNKNKKEQLALLKKKIV